MIFKKEPSFYERQLKIWEKECEKYPIGSPEWNKAYNMVGRIHQDMKDDNINSALNWKKADITIRGFGVVGGIGLGIWKLISYINMGKMAYNHNKNLDPKDGESWKIKDDILKIDTKI